LKRATKRRPRSETAPALVVESARRDAGGHRRWPPPVGGLSTAMGDKMATDAQLAALRDFAGPQFSDAELRRFLVRSSGNVDHAAELVLSEKPAAAAANRTTAGASSLPPAPSALPSAGGERGDDACGNPPTARTAAAASRPPPPLASDVKKAAWKVFYKANYAKAQASLGPDCTRAQVTARVADAWRDLAPHARDELYVEARDDLMRIAAERAADAVPASPLVAPPSAPKVPAAEGDHRAPSSARKVARTCVASDAPSSCAAVAAAAALPGKSDGADEPDAAVNVDAAGAAGENDAVIDVDADAGGGLGVDGNDGDAVMCVDSYPENASVAAWPKAFASRILACSMTVSGRGVVRAGQEVELVPCQGNIVRFSSNAREIGRLPSAVARYLAPALASGFVTSIARVVEAPHIARVLSTILVDVTLSMRKDIFQPPGFTSSPVAKGKAVRAGGGRGKGRGKGKGNGKGKGKGTGGAQGSGRGGAPGSADDGSEGIDLDRIAVENLLTHLHACEPSSRGPLTAAAPKDVPPVDGFVGEAGAEAYYDVVHGMDAESGVPEYVHPGQLLCSLREYQKVGVSWMRAREMHGNSRQGATDATLHPLWHRRSFPDGVDFYSNGTTGGMCLEPPSASQEGPYGGILADEMGLGKTVESIAVVVLDRLALDAALLLAAGEDKAGSAPGVGSDKGDNHAGAGAAALDSDAARTTIAGGAEQSGRKPAVRCSTAEDAAAAAESVDAPRACAGGRPGAKRAPTERGAGEGGADEDRADSGDDCAGAANSGVDDADCSSESDEADDVDDRDFVCETRVARAHVAQTPAGGRQGHGEAAEPCWIRSGDFSRRSSAYGRLHSLRGAEKTGKCASRRQGGTLLVVPMSMLGQWVSELEKHVEAGFLRCKTHHEQRGGPRELSVREADVVVTTYGVLASEAPGEDGDGKVVKEAGPLFQLEWRRAILDEAHSIKGRTTKNGKACFQLCAELRWCLTGSPIQNHVSDAQPLLQFLRVQPWSSWGFWQRGIVAKIESPDARLKAEAFSTLRSILSPITLRRLKSTTGRDGRPLVSLVQRTEEVVRLTPGAAELDFYETLHKKSKAKFNTFLAQGKVLNQWANVLELLLRLRQACCHPWLVFAASQADTNAMNDRASMYRLFASAGSAEYADKVLAEAGSSTCPICLSDVDDATAVKRCGHAACRACLDGVLAAEGGAAKCPICRAAIGSKADLVTLPRASGSRFPMDIQKDWQSSAKLDAILGELRRMEAARAASADGTAGKTVVMSQFTSFLDLVGTMLSRERIAHLRFDGTLTSRRRGEVLSAFAEDDERAAGAANVILVSLRAGNVGLNLVSASLCLLTDPSWNPMVDAQAAARVHRHGQTRAVTIKRLVVRDSVEERLLQVQERKLDMTEGALAAASKEDRRARIERMKLLFSR
jgi:SNF2 family DNA or RNA helicase